MQLFGRFQVHKSFQLALLFSCAMASIIPSSDLQFQMEEAGVSAKVQQTIYAKGFTCMRSFAGIEESRAEVRAMLKAHFGLDASDPAMLRDIALVLSVWEACRTQLTYQEKNKQDARLGTQNRLVPNTEYAAMRAAVEHKLGALKDREVPSKALVAAKLEQVEDGAPVAEDLREVTSFEDTEGEAYSAIIDPATATLRIRPGKAKTVPPRSPEDLRLRHRQIGLAWDFVKTRHSTRAWLPSSAVEAFRKLSDFVLGSSVAGLRAADGRGPSWSLVLRFELELRKLAYRYVRNAQCKCLDEALEKAMVGPEALTTHFIVPFTLGDMAGDKNVERGSPTRPKLNAWERQWGKASATPAGKKICFKFNKVGGCHAPKCSFEHVCQRCYGKHSYMKCPHKKVSSATE